MKVNLNKKIMIYPIKSILHSEEIISKESKKLINELELKLNTKINILKNLNKINKNDLILILIQSGGSENIFKNEIFNKLDKYYLLTYASNNSLAASLEILSFIKQNNKNGEVLHGSLDYISKRIKEILSKDYINEITENLGVIGKPSDWLISSNVNYKKVKDKLNINLIDISEDELINLIKKQNNKNIFNINFNENELTKVSKVTLAIKTLINKYNLKGFTIRCFDLIPIFKTTPCLSLAYFNDKDIISGCEGDIPSLLTMYLVHKRLNISSFMANPQIVDITNNIIEFAHCTLPLNMANKYELTTHYESQIGIGIHADLLLKEVTVVKISSDIEKFYIEEGEIIQNQNCNDRCRTQIRIKLKNNSISYFLKNPLGNHHIIIYGNHKNELIKYFSSLNMYKIN